MRVSSLTCSTLRCRVSLPNSLRRQRESVSTCDGMLYGVCEPQRTVQWLVCCRKINAYSIVSSIGKRQIGLVVAPLKIKHRAEIVRPSHAAIYVGTAGEGASILEDANEIGVWGAL